MARISHVPLDGSATDGDSRLYRHAIAGVGTECEAGKLPGSIQAIKENHQLGIAIRIIREIFERNPSLAGEMLKTINDSSPAELKTKDKKLLKELDFKEGDFLDAYRVRIGADTLVEAYRDKG